MDTGIANTSDKIGSTMDKIDRKLKGLLSKLDQFLIMFTKKDQVGDGSYKEDLNKMKLSYGVLG